MSLLTQAQAEFARLSSPCSSPQRFESADAGQRFSCALTNVDSLGCAFETFELSSDRLANATIEMLKKSAEQLSTRITYLLESIRPIEIDADQCVVQMRSVPPTTDDGVTRYYELNVRRGGIASLSRYECQPGQLRVRIAAHLTREVFWRLLRDFADSL